MNPTVSTQDICSAGPHLGSAWLSCWVVLHVHALSSVMSLWACSERRQETLLFIEALKWKRDRDECSLRLHPVRVCVHVCVLAAGGFLYLPGYVTCSSSAAPPLVFCEFPAEVAAAQRSHDWRTGALTCTWSSSCLVRLTSHVIYSHPDVSTLNLFVLIASDFIQFHMFGPEPTNQLWKDLFFQKMTEVIAAYFPKILVKFELFWLKSQRVGPQWDDLLHLQLCVVRSELDVTVKLRKVRISVLGPGLNPRSC